MSRLEHHISKKHGSQKTEQYSCIHCKKIFSSKNNLEKHLKTHIKNLSDKQSNFECEICEKSFGLKKNLNKHMRNSYEEKP